jgi:hypothetical protein
MRFAPRRDVTHYHSHAHTRVSPQTFQAEIRCNQNMRRADKADLLIQNVKAGIQHLARLVLTAEKAGNLPPKMPGAPHVRSECRGKAAT